jgi:dTDP-D-glucose 4,6-dehydratase
MKKVFITGGDGALGKALKVHMGSNFEVLAPNKIECDVLNPLQLESLITQFSPDIVIHLAAFVDTFGCENDIAKALDVNVIGTINIVKVCSKINCKFVYVSSEYVFGGEKGSYSVKDRLDPINVYGKTKSASEYIVSILPNYQIIRAPFIRKIYPKVFTDQYCSRYFIDEVLDKIIDNILYNSDNIIHIASERTSLYELYKKKGIKAEPITMPENQLGIIPKDTSLINNSI